jgi:hypothetical protein
MMTLDEYVLGGNPLQWTSFGPNPEPETNPEFGTIANTTHRYSIAATLPTRALEIGKS